MQWAIESTGVEQAEQDVFWIDWWDGYISNDSKVQALRSRMLNVRVGSEFALMFATLQLAGSRALRAASRCNEWPLAALNYFLYMPASMLR